MVQRVRFIILRILHSSSFTSLFFSHQAEIAVVGLQVGPPPLTPRTAANLNRSGVRENFVCKRDNFWAGEA